MCHIEDFEIWIWFVYNDQDINTKDIHMELFLKFNNSRSITDINKRSNGSSGTLVSNWSVFQEYLIKNADLYHIFYIIFL